MIKFILALNFLFISFAFAELPKTYINEKCRCSETVSDPLEEPSAFNFGKFKDQCIDSCRFRPAKWLNPQNQKSWTVGNVLHLGQYYKTTISPESIESLSVGFEQFAPGVSHTTLRFHFRKNFEARLIPQNQNENSVPSKPVDSLVFSFEGAPAKDVKYSLRESFFGNYLIIPKLLTGEEYKAWASRLKHPLHFYPVPLAQNQVKAAFASALKTSENLGKNEIYRLFTNNCATKTISVLLQAKSSTDFQTLSWMNQTAASLPILGPISTFSFLRANDLIPKLD